MKIDLDQERKDTEAELQINGKPYVVDLSEAYEEMIERYWAQEKFDGKRQADQVREDNFDHLKNTRRWLIAQGVPSEDVTHGICRAFYSKVAEWWDTTYKKKLYVYRISEPELLTGMDSTQEVSATPIESDLSKISIASTPSDTLPPTVSET